ncbi:hypothetical protein NQ318_003172 [Aromia moschata]|uniref:Mos1 transposase HTH domain-containing protein n=1 Tax=Aromia moschata TaxID=1265417 RepID=A0AAV8XF48_9CUCU|nr:hypothetical protein NQ318_003172 [Aromia moschata]
MMCYEQWRLVGFGILVCWEGNFGPTHTTDGDQVLFETGEECCGNHPMLKKAFGVDCLSDRQIFWWHKAFAEGREDVNDENRAGRPSTSISDDNVKPTDGDQVLFETGEECCGNHPMLKKAFGVDCLSDRQIFWWHKAFAEGREDVNDENRAGRPSTSISDDNVKRVRDLLNTDRRLSVRLISETLDITKTIVHEIVSQSLGMRKFGVPSASGNRVTSLSPCP